MKDDTRDPCEHITLHDDDRDFIRDLLSMTKEKQALVKGIVIGLQMQECGKNRLEAVENAN